MVQGRTVRGLTHGVLNVQSAKLVEMQLNPLCFLLCMVEFCRICACPLLPRAPCDRLARLCQFASEDDMAAMGAPGVRLITAASDGDKKGVRRWLDQGVDVDSRDWDNLTPLIAASSQGHLVRAWAKSVQPNGCLEPMSLVFMLCDGVPFHALCLWLG